MASAVEPDNILVFGSMPIVDGGSFAAMCISLLITTGVITPLVRLYCNTSKRALNPCKQSPISVYMLHMIELTGSATLLLIPRKTRRLSSRTSSSSGPVINAFINFEVKYGETSLVIIPFNKKFHVNGALQSSKKTIKIANNNVLNKAPCSVAILIDRGAPKTLTAIWTSILASRLDNVVLDDFRSNISGNIFAKYVEELVREGAGTASVLRTLENHYELVVVGRRHYGLSPILSGLTEWNENRELGVMGDLLGSSDFLGNTTIWVVQQHYCGHGN
ncbi:hypothetical protein REPUB_Repub09cG0007700 [Reevesia pubescens]